MKDPLLSTWDFLWLMVRRFGGQMWTKDLLKFCALDTPSTREPEITMWDQPLIQLISMPLSSSVSRAISENQANCKRL